MIDCGEILDSLRIHANTKGGCGGCKYENGNSGCSFVLAKDAAEVIETLLAENEVLRNERNRN